MMNLRHFLYAFVVGVCFMALTSCEHRILMDPVDAHYVRVYFDEAIKNVNCGFYNETYEHPEYRRPLTMLACLADAQTGQIVSEGLLRNQGNDARGYYIDGHIAGSPGDYSLLLYQLGSPLTLIKHTGDYFTMQAYTSHVGDRIMGYLEQTSKVIGDDPIVLEPEHIMVARCDDVHIYQSMKPDTLKTSTGDFFTARTIAKSYYLQLKITGVQWVRSTAAVLSGLSGSSLLCKEEGMIETDPVNLYFSMMYGGSKKRSSGGGDGSEEVLYTTFTTFGKIPDLTSELTLNFEFAKSDGSSQVETIDLTEVFKTPLAIENQWLLLDKEIAISRPIGGGMDPGVDGWKEEEADLPM